MSNQTFNPIGEHIEPEVMLDLIESQEDSVATRRLRGHLMLCPECNAAYVALWQAWQEAEAVRPTRAVIKREEKGEPITEDEGMPDAAPKRPQRSSWWYWLSPPALAIGAAACGLLFYLGVYQPQQREVASRATRITTLERQHQEDTTRIASLSQGTSERERLDQQVKALGAENGSLKAQVKQQAGQIAALKAQSPSTSRPPLEEQALNNALAKPSKDFAAILPQKPTGKQMGNEPTSEAVSYLKSPLYTAVTDSRPLLEIVPPTDGKAIQVMLTQGIKVIPLKRVSENGTRWQPLAPLAPGTYTWGLQGKPGTAEFRVLPADKVAEAQRIRKRYPKEPLKRVILLANLGLVEEAKGILNTLGQPTSKE